MTAVDLQVTVADLEARLADLTLALAEVRRQVARAACPTEHTSHDHTADGRCICPQCGLVFAMNLAARYRLRHLSTRHETCPDCGRSFASLAMHRRVHQQREVPPELTASRVEALVGAGMRSRGYG